MKAHWVPRLQNVEADALTNLDFRHFSTEKRIQVSLEELPFEVLPQFLAEGEKFVLAMEELEKEQARARPAQADLARKGARGKRKPRKPAGLSPWYGGC